jgi:transcriptional regulator with XRE-family HTH domain
MLALMQGYQTQHSTGGLIKKTNLDLKKQKPLQNICVPTLVIERIRKTNAWFMAELILQFIQRRYELQITQRELSERIGVDSGLVSKWEIGYRRPSSFMIFQWAEALETKIEARPCGEEIKGQGSKRGKGNRQHFNWRRIQGKANRPSANLPKK